MRITTRNRAWFGASLLAITSLLVLGCGDWQTELNSSDPSLNAYKKGSRRHVQHSTPAVNATDPRRFRVHVAGPSMSALAKGKLRRHGKIWMEASFYVFPKDRALKGSVVLSPVDARLTGGKSAARGSDSTSRGAIRLPFSLKKVKRKTRRRLGFSMRPKGWRGSAVIGELQIRGQGVQRTSEVFAMDGKGVVRRKDPRSIYKKQWRGVLTNEVVRTQALTWVKKTKLPAAKLELGLFGKKVPGNLKYLYYPKGCFKKHKLCFTGRVSFDDPHGCSSPVMSQNVPWDACHKFKQHFDVNGNNITKNTHAKEALRPLASTVELTYYKLSPTSFGIPLHTQCGKQTVQTNSKGFFIAAVDTCHQPGATVRVIARVKAQYTPLNAKGQIRGLWPMGKWLTALAGSTQVVVGETVYSTATASYSVPTLATSQEVKGGEPKTKSSNTKPNVLAMGNLVFLPKADGDSFNWVRESLSAYMTTVQLHARLRKDLASPHVYDDMFNKGFFNVFFDADWPHGGFGGISLFQWSTNPDAYHLLSTTRLVAHELGHAIHAAFAPASLKYDYNFANKMIRKDGSEYSWGHGGDQYQEIGVSFVEGLANGLGQYLLNGCNTWNSAARPLGGVVPFSNNAWSGDTSCDNSDGCASHHFRYQMKKRGVAEGSTTYNDRLAVLQQMTQTLDTLGQGRTTSNSETRVGELICDLLDSDTSVTHAAGINGQSYVEDFTYHVGRALDGTLTGPINAGTFTVQTYGAPAAETAQISLPELLSAAAGFCSGGCTLPSSYGASYNTDRLSATQGKLSPQRLVQHLVGQGWVSAADGTNVLRTNFMEEDFSN